MSYRRLSCERRCDVAFSVVGVIGGWSPQSTPRFDFGTKLDVSNFVAYSPYVPWLDCVPVFERWCWCLSTSLTTKCLLNWVTKIRTHYVRMQALMSKCRGYFDVSVRGYEIRPRRYRSSAIRIVSFGEIPKTRDASFNMATVLRGKGGFFTHSFDWLETTWTWLRFSCTVRSSAVAASLSKSRFLSHRRFSCISSSPVSVLTQIMPFRR